MLKLVYGFFMMLFFLSLTHCGKLNSANLAVESIDERISPTYDGPPEPTYCGGPTSFTGPNITVSGTAKYEYRELIYTTTFKGLGDVPEDEDGNPIHSPIRRAEVVILNSENEVVQCGETDAEGDFSLTLPNDGGIYRVRVYSRGFSDDHVKASVLRSPESNYLYYIEKVFTADGNKSYQLLANATGSLEGGAFHIFDQILEYNIKLRELVGTCDTGSYTGCTPFTTAPKVNVYWEKGFNPGSYLPGSPQSSFYYKGTNRIFLLGGVDGDVNYADTDHFDRSIIAHEYFHFIESTMGRTSSPGGSHNGNQLLDPRLAWSEGAAQYFQGVMTGISRVLDSRGNISGASALIVDFSLEQVDTDESNLENEGEFREFSVARILWDTYDDTPGETFSTLNCDVPDISDVHDKCAKDGFPLFWSALTGSNGFKNTNHAFISASLMHDLQNKIVGTTPAPEQNWTPLRVFEFQAHDRYPASGASAERTPFGSRLVDCGTAHTFTMNPPFLSAAQPNWLNSHLVTNNNFLHYRHAGGELRIEAHVSFNSGLNANINLIVYQGEDFYIGDTSTIVGRSTVPYGTGSTVSYSVYPPENYPAGDYMINLNVITTSGNGNITYTLRRNGSTGLCPVQ